MKAEIICIGDELLLGQTIDTNSAWMGKELAKIGVDVVRKTTISDKAEDIKEAIAGAIARNPIVLVTGGLGPTKDDITKNTLAELFNSGWREDKEVLEHLAAIFASRGRELLETNRLQAQLPDNCITLFNETGTAPGMLFLQNNAMVFSMPGVPNEMEHIMTMRVIPYLIQNCNLPHIKYRTLLTIGIPESMLAKQLEGFESSLPQGFSLAYLPAYNSIRLRLTAKGEPAQPHLNKFDELFEQLIKECGTYFVKESEDEPANVLAKLLIEKNIKTGTAESCTGGLMAAKLVTEPGVSAIFKGGIVSYANEVKVKQLNVPEAIIEVYGVVSEECATAMVKGALAALNVDLAIATTGIAGPGGGTPEKPVGTIYIGVGYRGTIKVQKFNFRGSRERFRNAAVTAAVKMAIDLIDNT